MNPASILWKRLDRPGHESARIRQRDAGCTLEGTAVFTHEGQPCRLDYEVICDAVWRTKSGRVSGWVGEKEIVCEISVDAQHHWQLNGSGVDAVNGCIDLDLNFSPSTNLLPIRRLNLGVGEEGSVRAAWLGFPSFQLEPLEQIYRRLGPTTYRYESAGGRFVAELEVDESGLVTKYPGGWEAVR